MNRVAPWLLGLVSLVAGPVAAQEVWVVRFSAAGGIIDPPCAVVIWSDDLVFHNATQTDLTVGWLGTSNGGARDPLPLVVPAGKTRAGFDSGVSEIGSWSPASGSQLWVVHLDVPAGISVLSRAIPAIGTDPTSCGPDPAPAAAFGGPRLPVVRRLAPPGAPQVLLATDIGEAGKFSGARSKVAIYNGGSSTATATIELHRGCDDTTYDVQTAAVAPDTITQVAGLRSLEDVINGCAALNSTPSLSYTIVTVDQPSFSFTTTLSNELPPRTPFGFALAD